MATEPGKKWEEVQKKAFTHWVNSQLVKRDESIENLHEGFSSGLKLITLIEILSGKTIAKYTKNPRLKAHKINNCFIALKFLQEECQVKNLTVAAEDFVQGQQMNLILGFCWLLLRNFQDPATEKGGKSTSFEASLLNWVKDMIGDYPDIDLTEGFKSKCWFNGKALLALLKEYDNTILDYKSFDPEDKLQNCETALRLAEEHAHVPMELLDHVELAEGKTSDKNLVLYLSLFYNSFKHKFQDITKETLLERIKAIQEKIKIFVEENEILRNKRSKLELSSKDINEKLSVLNEEQTSLILTKEETESRLSSLQESYDSETTLLQATIDELSQNINLLQSSGKDHTTALESAKDEMKKERDAIKEELAQTRDQLTKEKEELEAELDQLSNNLRRTKKEHEALEGAVSEKQETNGKGIHSLRKHLLKHVQMMHVYKNFLEQDRDYESEDLHIDMEPDLDELSFPEQVKTLDAALHEENEKLEKLLSQRKDLTAKKASTKKEEVKKEKKEPSTPRGKKK